MLEGYTSEPEYHELNDGKLSVSLNVLTGCRCFYKTETVPQLT